MLRRFFRSCEFCVSRISARPETQSLWDRLKIVFHRQELRSLPTKLNIWGSRIDPKKFPHNAPEQVQAVAYNAQMIAYRVDDLIEAGHTTQAALIVKELGENLEAWLMVIEKGFNIWAVRPESGATEDLRPRLMEGLKRLDARIEETLNRASEEEISDQESRNFYRLLGGFRGVTQAAVAYAGVAGKIDWEEWREERF